MSIYAVLTPTTACRALHEAGFPHPAEALHIDAREERWAVSLPDGHIAWFPASEAGATRLAVERRVLGLLATRCSFRVPEILFVSNSGFDVRRMCQAGAILGVSTAAARTIPGWRRKSDTRLGKSSWSSTPGSSRRTPLAGCGSRCRGRRPAPGLANAYRASSTTAV
jgi:hypothetical protein